MTPRERAERIVGAQQQTAGCECGLHHSDRCPACVEEEIREAVDEAYERVIVAIRRFEKGNAAYLESLETAITIRRQIELMRKEEAKKP